MHTVAVNHKSEHSQVPQKPQQNKKSLDELNDRVLNFYPRFYKHYVCTGCDYISFLHRIGKASFFRYFFQYATFITSGLNHSTPGTLADVGLLDNSHQLGYLSFIRLVGTAYHKLHSTGFNTHSPENHY